MSAREEGGLDLNGDWDGMYSYPHALPPVSFRAKLTEQGGALGGVIEEQASKFKDPLRRLRAAWVEGRRLGLAVTFLKRYEDRAVHYDVDYEGSVTLDGSEISGRWSIFGHWSGPFLMVRRPGKSMARTRASSARTNI